MRKKNKKIIAVILIAALAVFIQQKIKHTKPDDEITREIKPFSGSIQNIISATGTVLPKNRLEIKPPVSGRIEEMLVEEGEKVKSGHTLAQMSSTERAALLDAARGKGEEELKYFEDVYKTIPLISPIDGEVIVAKLKAGQTVTTADAVLVLSDTLIIRAQVDETDIGKIKLGQDAVVILDAYPDESIKAKVEHLYYESKTVNNVTIYEVDLLPESMPPSFRSGMNATVNFIESGKENILLLPLDAVTRRKGGSFVYVKGAGEKEYIEREAEFGISDDKNVEIIKGISADDTVVMKMKKYELPRSDAGTNPFMPARRR